MKGAGSDYIWKEQVIVLLFHLRGFCWNYENNFFCDLFSVPLGRIPSPSRPQGSSVAPCVSWNWVACCLIGHKFLLPQLRVYTRNHQGLLFFRTKRHGEVKFRPFFRLVFASGSHLKHFATSEMDTAYLGQGRCGDWDLGSAPLCYWLYATCTSCPNNKAIIGAFSNQLAVLRPCHDLPQSCRPGWGCLCGVWDQFS